MTNKDGVIAEETASAVETVETQEQAAIETAPEAAEVAVEAVSAEVASEPASETADIAAEASVSSEEPKPVQAEAKQEPKKREIPARHKSEFEKMVDASIVQYSKGKRIKDAIVISADARGINISIGGKNDGFIPAEEAILEGEYKPEDFIPGVKLDAIITGKDGSTVLLSKKEVDAIKAVDKIIDTIRNGEHFTVKVKAIEKGLLSRLGSYRVFVPQSHVADVFLKDISGFDGKRLTMKALKIDDDKREVVASVKEAVRIEREKRAVEFFDQIQVDMVVKGKIMRLAKFGAFVDVNGFDCLAHIGELSWNKINNVSDVLKEGEEHEFLVLKVDKDKRKVSLGYKQLQPHPFDSIIDQFPIGSAVTGKVVRLCQFGAFVEIANGVDGLVHISEASHNYVKDISEVLKVGDTVSAILTKIDPDTRKISLSIKAATAAPEIVERKPFNKFDRKTEEGDNKEQSFRKEKRPRPPKTSEEPVNNQWNETAANNPFSELAALLKNEDE